MSIERPPFGELLRRHRVAAVLRLAESVLQANGYHVLTAQTRAEALVICREYAGAIHLLLADVILPGIDGRDLVEEFLAIRPETRVLCMSGYPPEVAALHGILTSEIAFLQKPFTLTLLTAKVREVLGSAAAEELTPPSAQPRLTNPSLLLAHV